MRPGQHTELILQALDIQVRSSNNDVQIEGAVPVSLPIWIGHHCLGDERNVVSLKDPNRRERYWRPMRARRKSGLPDWSRIS